MPKDKSPKGSSEKKRQRGSSENDDKGSGRHKRRRDSDADDGGEPAAPAGGPTIGMQTSHIKNKLVRSETYQKLKHKQKASAALAEGQPAEQ